MYEPADKSKITPKQAKALEKIEAHIGSSLPEDEFHHEYRFLYEIECAIDEFFAKESNLVSKIFPFISGIKIENQDIIDLGFSGLDIYTDSLPNSMKDLEHLKILDLSTISFEYLPKFITNLKTLKTLNLNINNLDEFPKLITELASLILFIFLSRLTITNNFRLFKSLLLSGFLYRQILSFK